MRTILMIALILKASLIHAQNKRFPVKGHLSQVTEWGSLSLWIGKDFFAATKDSVISQIGEDEFNEMMYRCSTAGWPAGFYKSGMSDAEDKTFEEKLGTLRMYKIASFRHIYNGVVYDRYSILRIPFDENENWDPAFKWNGNIYFLIKEEALK